ARIGSSGWTPMRLVAVKSPVRSVSENKPPSSRRAASRPTTGPRRRRASDAEIQSRNAAGHRRQHERELAAPFSQEPLAPARLLSVSALCTEHQNRRGDAWPRAPLLELGVTVVNPSSRRALAPAHWSPTCDRGVVPAGLQRFQLCPVWNDPRLQIAPERD